MAITIATRLRAPPAPPAMAAMFKGDPPLEFVDWVGGGVGVTVVVEETQTVEPAGGWIGLVVVGEVLEVVSEDIVGGAGAEDSDVWSGGKAKGKSPG